MTDIADNAAPGNRPAAFLLVGAIGFAVDAGLTAGLVAAGLDPFSARALAILAAVATTWGLNRRLTFRMPAAAAGALAREGARYGLVAAAGSAVNWLVYSAALLAAPGLPPLAALVLGSGVAMAANWLGYSRFAFRR